MVNGYVGTLIVMTLAVSLASIAFGGTNVFDCDDPNDCTMAALDDLADFNFLEDIGDIFTFLFILFGDILEMLSFAAVPGIPEMIRLALQLVIGVGWIVTIIYFAVL